MAEAQEKSRLEAEGRAGPQPDASARVPSPRGVRGWESLKAALRHFTSADRSRTLPHIASAA